MNNHYFIKKKKTNLKHIFKLFEPATAHIASRLNVRCISAALMKTVNYVPNAKI